jgi:phospholipid/cholesterol/gamma-HCH transport system substrate-binding protein
MSAKTNNFKLGLFTLFGLGLLLTGLLAFGTWSKFEKKSLFETYVPGDVSGLSVGSAVEFRGVRVGKVAGIGFSWNEYQDSQPGSVVVVFEMRDDIFTGPSGSGWQQLQSAVDHGLRARLKAQGVTGTCIVSLEYLDPAEYLPAKVSWTPRHTYIPSAPGLLGDLLESLQKVLHKVNRLDVSALTQLTETDLKSVSRVLDKVERVDLDALSTNANALLQQIRGSTSKIDNLIDDTDGTVKKLPLEKLTQDADKLMQNADKLVAQVSDTVARLKPGLTSVDFDSLNQTVAEARQAIQNMNDVLNELKKYPSGFIFGQPPPRLKEVQPANK